ncbi:hypothetical protein V8F20_003967 [Naviculisporaceae sp. PSN 640]
MGLFDSASDTQKKKRNQRKDVSIVKKMGEDSQKVLPLDGVYSQDMGTLVKTKNV